jgi:hypothetical protein
MHFRRRGIQLETISEEAFSGAAITEISLPRSLKVLEKRCFFACDSLTEVTWEKCGQCLVMEEEAFGGDEIGQNIHPAVVGVHRRENCPRKYAVGAGKR